MSCGKKSESCLKPVILKQPKYQIPFPHSQLSLLPAMEVQAQALPWAPHTRQSQKQGPLIQIHKQKFPFSSKTSLVSFNKCWILRFNFFPTHIFENQVSHIDLCLQHLQRFPIPSSGLWHTHLTAWNTGILDHRYLDQYFKSLGMKIPVSILI